MTFYVTYVIVRSIDELVLSRRHCFQLQILYSDEWNEMVTSGDCIRVVKKSTLPYVEAWQKGSSSEY